MGRPYPDTKIKRQDPPRHNLPVELYRANLRWIHDPKNARGPMRKRAAALRQQMMRGRVSLGGMVICIVE